MLRVSWLRDPGALSTPEEIVQPSSRRSAHHRGVPGPLARAGRGRAGDFWDNGQFRRDDHFHRGRLPVRRPVHHQSRPRHP